ncbi:hypothetical protein FCL40_03145 [Ferrimonas sediminicola]|uniref:DUF4440 domain-containing protein n=1 Tax=Ferrimonas sediminicola TaxID=2569538 RepID=A0A4U1BJ64_9GAMM|nr:hypothetical protein [Ferrimonas sediminicola]TKB51566.1 hypothetical protein FCL40_03145 [Ferrimonas sediminicola]
MLKPLAILTFLLASPQGFAQIDVTIPKEHCLKAVDIVANKDLTLMKQIYMPIEASDAQYRAFIQEIHDWAFVKDYSGINEFTTKGVKIFEHAKTSDNDYIRGSAQRWGHDTEVWVYYSFHSTNRTTNAPATKGGFCQFALLNDTWYMINLLK